MATLAELISRGGAEKRAVLEKSLTAGTRLSQRKEDKALRELQRAALSTDIDAKKQQIKSQQLDDVQSKIDILDRTTTNKQNRDLNKSADARATLAQLRADKELFLKEQQIKEQNRLNQSAEERAQSAEGRATESLELQKQVQKQQLTTMELEGTMKAKQLSDTVLNPMVEQALGLHNAYTSGDPNAKASRDNLILSILKDDKLRTAFKASIPFYDMADTTPREYLEMTEDQKAQSFVMLQNNLEQYRTMQKQEAARSADATANAQYELQRAAAKGSTVGQIEGRQQLGLPEVEEAVDATALKTERKREGDLWLDSARSMGFKDAEIKEFGLSSSDFENMEHDVFSSEKSVMDKVIAAGISEGSATIFGQDIDFKKPQKGVELLLELAQNEPIFDATSPYYKILTMLDKKGTWKDLRKKSNMGNRAEKVLRSSIPNQ